MSEKAKPKKKKTVRRTPKVLYANLTNTHYMSVRQCVEEMGFRLTDSEYRHCLLWCDSAGSIETASGLEPWQFYNHFPGIWSIAHKVELARNLDRMARLLPDIYKFHPKTFLLPGQFSDLKSYMYSIPKKTQRTFIVKPDRGAQGKGIILCQDPEALSDYYEMAVAQRYIAPYLIDGYKFDLRIYILVTSVDPLRMYINKEGMARFCTEPYVKPSPGNLDHCYAHLTNYSLNKKNEDFVQPTDAGNADTGSKRSLTSVLKAIKAQGQNPDAIMEEIADIARLTLASVQPFLANNYHTAVTCNDGKSRCFEIFGFDILLDSDCHPWLLEVNCMPSLSCDSPFDEQLKFNVIKGALKIIDIPLGFKAKVLARQKAVAQKRIAGATDLPIIDLFDPAKESEIAKTTTWEQIYPMDPSNPNISRMEQALQSTRAVPVGAAVETAASRARKEAVAAQLREQNEPKTFKPRQIKKLTTPKVIGPLDKQAEKPADPKKLNRPVIAAKSTPSSQTKSIVAKTRVKYEDERVFTQFYDFSPSMIDDDEEKARIKAIRHQVLILQSVNMLQRIRLMLGESTRVVFPHQEDKPKRARPQKQVMKPVIIYKQVILTDGIH